MPDCGLITSAQKPVPLKGISVDVVIRGFIADVVSELRYQNEEKSPVEAVFVFPLDDEAAVYAFEGLIGGTRIEARIQEKKKAEQEYEDALAEGREAFLLEGESETSDIFSCSLGNLPPKGEATLKLRYVQALAPETDGAVRFVLPAVLNPRYQPRGSESKGITKLIPRLPKGQLPYSLSLKATLESPYAINRVESKCTLTELNYVAKDRTSAEISLAEGHQFDRDVELLIYYDKIHKPSALLEKGKTGAASGTLMGDPALLLTLYPSLPASKPAVSNAGEFIFLLDRSGSMGCNIGDEPKSPTRIQSAKETLVLLLKSLPLGCYFNIYSFGSHYDSFYPKSVEYTQQTMSESLQRVKEMDADYGGTEILQPLQAIYRQPFQEEHPRQVLVFTDGEVGNTDEVISEVRRHSNSHRCFSFGIGEGASTALIKGIARAAGGSAEFITGKERMQAKVMQTLKRALQPAVTGISLRWDLPSGLEAKVVGSGPQVIFEGQRCLIYAQISGHHKTSKDTHGTVELQYTFQDQTIKETMKFPLQVQESSRLPVHLLAAQTLLQELEGVEEEGKRRLALETSLNSGVVCSETAYVGVNTELGRPLQGPLIRRDIPLGISASFYSAPVANSCTPTRRMYKRAAPKAMLMSSPGIPMGLQFSQAFPGAPMMMLRGGGPIRGKQHILACASRPRQCNSSSSMRPKPTHLLQCGPGKLKVVEDAEDDSESFVHKEEESPFLKLVSLQNADGSWPLDAGLASLLGLSEAEISSKTPAKVVPNAWATVLAILWLHSNAAEQIDEWQLLEAKALRWLQSTAGPKLAECVKTGNALLRSNVSLQALGL